MILCRTTTATPDLTRNIMPRYVEPSTFYQHERVGLYRLDDRERQHGRLGDATLR
jgi:hypothetical protein